MHQRITRTYAARIDRAGDDDPDPRERKAPVDCEAEVARIFSGDGIAGCRSEKLVEFCDTFAVDCGTRHHRRIFEHRANRQIADLDLNFCDAARIGAINLRQCNDAAFDADQINDGQMLAGLRHDAIVGRHNQDNEVDANGAGQHVVNELFVAGHVEKADRGGIGEMLIGKPQIDRDAALFLFRQAVGIGARQRLQQRRFAVVDMPCCTDDHGSSITLTYRNQYTSPTR